MCCLGCIAKAYSHLNLCTELSLRNEKLVIISVICSVSFTTIERQNSEISVYFVQKLILNCDVKFNLIARIHFKRIQIELILQFLDRLMLKFACNKTTKSNLVLLQLSVAVILKCIIMKHLCRQITLQLTK